MIGYHARMTSKCNAQARRWLAQHSTVASGQQPALAALAPELLNALPQGNAWLLGLNGPPGTGKTTLAGMLAAVDRTLRSAAGREATAPMVVLSLDDYYLSHDERLRLARKVHPKLAQRGVPGTHDTNRLFADIDRLSAGQAGTLSVPRFHKGRDEREPRGRELLLDGRPARVILEGWCVGIPPRMTRPSGDASIDEDRDSFSLYVTQAHAQFYENWSRRAAGLWTLAAPDFETVVHWRWQQEQELPGKQRMLPDIAAVRMFLQPFEPLIKYQLRQGAQWADLIIQLDKDHHPHLQCPP